jgi:hypothetical protein
MQHKLPNTTAPGDSLDQLVSRELEIKQVELAIAKTEAAQVRATESLDALYDKKCRQMAELRFQKMLLSMDKQRAALAANEQAHT